MSRKKVDGLMWTHRMSVDLRHAGFGLFNKCGYGVEDKKDTNGSSISISGKN